MPPVKAAKREKENEKYWGLFGNLVKLVGLDPKQKILFRPERDGVHCPVGILRKDLDGDIVILVNMVS